MPNPLTKLIDPWYPATALGLEKGIAAMVQLEGGRKNVFSLRRAASITLAESLISPSFDQPNIADLAELAEALTELATTAGLLRQRKWSVTLPEATSRTLILTRESHAGSKSELDDVLKWKMERGFGSPLEELSISNESLPPDSQGRARYLAVAVRLSVLAEYESVFAALGWRSGLVLPRHLGEARWLIRDGEGGDSLLVTSHEDGFTAAVFRGRQPLILRSVLCEPAEREDEFYRLLLFYRDRRGAAGEAGARSLSRLLVIGAGFAHDRVSEIANETLGGHVRVLTAKDVGLQLPAADLSFDFIAAPAGLATMHWN
jgi:hypothetical protein